MAVKRDANVGRKRAAPESEDERPTKKTRASARSTTATTSIDKQGSRTAKQPESKTRVSTRKATSARSGSNTKPSAISKPASKRTTASEITKPSITKSKSSAIAKTAKPSTTKPSSSVVAKVVQKKTSSKTESKVAAAPKETLKPRAVKAARASPKPPVGPKTPTVPTTKSAQIISSRPTEKLIVFACGEGSAGELGLGPKAIDVKRPRLNGLLDVKTVGVVQVATGGMHCLALTHDNRILTWGVNDQGALGRDTTFEEKTRDADADSDDEDDAELNPRESTPAPVLASAFPKGTDFVQVAAGDSCSFALTNTGLVYGWGTFRDAQGVWGFTLDENEDIIVTQNTPMLIKYIKDIISISCGADYVLALDNRGRVFGWGNGQQFQLGRKLIERRKNHSLLPARIPLPRGTKAVSIFASTNHAFVIDQSGDVWSWGLNNFGQTGVQAGAGQDGSTTDAPTVVSSLAGLNIKLVSGGNHHSIAVSESGKVFAWGRMDLSQIGIPIDQISIDDPEVVVKDDREKPRILLRPAAVPVPPSSFVAAGSDHNIAITMDGKAYTWGLNGTYQLGLGHDDDVGLATSVSNTAVNDKHLTWAGAGGQFSIFVGRLADAQAQESAEQSVTTSLSDDSESE